MLEADYIDGRSIGGSIVQKTVTIGDLTSRILPVGVANSAFVGYGLDKVTLWNG